MDADSFFESKYDINPSNSSIPSTVTFFPDMSQFEDNEDDCDQPTEKPMIPSDWELKKIGAFQSRIENIQNEKDSKFYTGLHNLAKLSAHEIFGLANDVFGYNGWSSLVMDSAIVRQEFRETEENIDGAAKYSAKFSAVVRVTLRDGYWNEQVGQGVSYSLPSKYQCFSKCKKEAVTDGMKKAIIGFRLALLDYERIKKEEE